jgi:hypothetical protein
LRKLASSIWIGATKVAVAVRNAVLEPRHQPEEPSSPHHRIVVRSGVRSCATTELTIARPNDRAIVEHTGMRLMGETPSTLGRCVSGARISILLTDRGARAGPRGPRASDLRSACFRGSESAAAEWKRSVAGDPRSHTFLHPSPRRRTQQRRDAAEEIRVLRS